MATHFEDVYILTSAEYEKLTSPDVTYTLMTKTAANKGVINILKKTNSVCWLDSNDESYEGYCNTCPVFEYLGPDAGGRLCTRQKSWQTLG